MLHWTRQGGSMWQLYKAVNAATSGLGFAVTSSVLWRISNFLVMQIKYIYLSMAFLAFLVSYENRLGSTCCAFSVPLQCRGKQMSINQSDWKEFIVNFISLFFFWQRCKVCYSFFLTMCVLLELLRYAAYWWICRAARKLQGRAWAEKHWRHLASYSCHIVSSCCMCRTVWVCVSVCERVSCCASSTQHKQSLCRGLLKTVCAGKTQTENWQQLWTNLRNCHSVSGRRREEYTEQGRGGLECSSNNCTAF